jgi:predicted transcriptional regulator
MKTATIPPLRVTPDLREAAENVLRKGETLSNFVEESVRSQIERRRMQQDFLDRGLAARADARATGAYVSQAEVMGSLRGILKKAEQRRPKQTRRR